MHARRDPPPARGFTLLELLVVVVLLGALAAIVLPQLNSSSLQVRETLVRTNLTHLRMAIDVYRAQHGDRLPDAAIMRQLASKTDPWGAPGTEYGPYVRKGFPENPLSGVASVKIVEAMPLLPAGRQGWVYDRVRGEIRLNTGGQAPSGVAWYDL